MLTWKTSLAAMSLVLMPGLVLYALLHTTQPIAPESPALDVIPAAGVPPVQPSS